MFLKFIIWGCGVIRFFCDSRYLIFDSHEELWEKSERFHEPARINKGGIITEIETYRTIGNELLHGLSSNVILNKANFILVDVSVYIADCDLETVCAVSSLIFACCKFNQLQHQLDLRPRLIKRFKQYISGSSFTYCKLKNHFSF